MVAVHQLKSEQGVAAFVIVAIVVGSSFAAAADAVGIRLWLHGPALHSTLNQASWLHVQRHR